MQYEHKFVSSQQQFVNDFIHFKLIVSNIIKIVEYYLMEFFIFNEPWFFLTTNSTTWQKRRSILYSFFDIWIFVRSIFLQLTQYVSIVLYSILHSIPQHKIFDFFFYLIAFSYILLHFLFTETNSSWLIYESIKALDISTSMVSNLVFPSNTILSWFFLFFLIIDLYFWFLQLLLRNKNKKTFGVIQSPTHFFMLFPHYIIMFYFL